MASKFLSRQKREKSYLFFLNSETSLTQNCISYEPIVKQLLNLYTRHLEISPNIRINL